jgi:uncharacterized SAM-binding protein YcdF (DUF218 family)
MEVALTLGLSDGTGFDHVTLRLIALFAGALLATTRAARLLWIGAIAVCVLLLLVMFSPLVERPAMSLLRADADGASPDAIVVYSAGFTDAGHINDIALTRLVSALDDAHALGVTHVVVSEQLRTVRGRTISTASDQRRIAGLLGGGVSVHVVTGVTNTHDESLAFAAYSRTRGWTNLRAVTSPLHARRACETLEATGMQVTCAPSASRDVAITNLDSPGARLIALRAALHEALGLVVYTWRGWL